jgi:tetratricopeptide (TPR) repeat protein
MPLVSGRPAATSNARLLQDKSQQPGAIMLRLISTLICTAFLVTSVHAAGLADLKAAGAAADSGNSDEAIRLFTQALSSNELTPDDQASAHGGRGREYSAKSLIADAFERRDDAKVLRENAIADFSAELTLKPGDVNTLLDRGQAYHLNQQYDLAVADFGAALSHGNSPVILLQRATSLRAKGAYDEAIADCSAALADPPDARLDVWDIYNERGYTEFLAGRFETAAADFNKALELGAPSRTDDVLWLPYQIAWLHVANARSGHADAKELGDLATKINLKQWPGTLIAFFLGQTPFEDLSSGSSHGAMGRSRDCNLSLFVGEAALGKGDQDKARQLMLRAREACNIHTLQYVVADAELHRIKP